MPDLISSLGQNYRKTASPYTNFGTRKLAWYTFMCDEIYGLAATWSESNSLYSQIVQKLQESNVEFFYLGRPFNTTEAESIATNFTSNIPDGRDAFTFAMADDADAPMANECDRYNYTILSADALTGTLLIEGTFNNNTGSNSDFTVSTDYAGLKAGQHYYIDYVNVVFPNTVIKVSDTVINRSFDTVYPQGHGLAGSPVAVTTESGTATMTVYQYAYQWTGTAGDAEFDCCCGTAIPAIGAGNLLNTIINSLEIPNSYMFRAQPSTALTPIVFVTF